MGAGLLAKAGDANHPAKKTKYWPFIQLSYFSHRVFTRPADTWPRLNTPYLLGVRHETEAFDGGNDFCRCWRCDCQRGCRC
ncbi:hypothetical protein C1X64_12525 [Pseudomonas sp. GW456-E7]|nr:hypothetical protein C1X64_12525 [Pseudomonas sp. GW456-E7]